MYGQRPERDVAQGTSGEFLFFRVTQIAVLQIAWNSGAKPFRIRISSVQQHTPNSFMFFRRNLLVKRSAFRHRGFHVGD